MGQRRRKEGEGLGGCRFPFLLFDGVAALALLSLAHLKQGLQSMFYGNIA